MKKYSPESIHSAEAKTFREFSARYFKTPKGWPVSIAHETIYKNGRTTPFFVHKRTSEFVYVISGKARADLGGKSFKVSGGDYLVIPPGEKHRFVTGKEEMVAISVFNPPIAFDNPDAAACEGEKKKKRIK